MLRKLFDLERPSIGGTDDGGGEDRVALVAARSAIADARDRNERHVERIAVVTAVLGAATITWRGVTTDGDRSFVVSLLVTVAVGVYYAYSLFGGDAKSTRTKRWTRTTLEVCSATAVTLVNIRQSPELGLLTSAHYAYFLVIATSTLRLDPWVSIYATTLSVVSHLSVYIGLKYFYGLPPTVVFHPAIFAFRLSAMALTGTVGWAVASTLREKTVKVATETLARERVRATFGHYVDERVVDRVLSGTLSTGPERRTITVLFLDIRSFTTYAEERDPVEVFRSLHVALEAFSAEIRKQGGLTNKFLGDGLLALFGAPEAQPDHARRAVRAALDIAAAAKRLSEGGAFPGLSIGIGIHTGEAMVGNLGGARREYTAIGDVVNVASRVEALNKELGTSILVTQPVRDALGPDAEVKTFPSVTIRGRKEPISLYEVQRVPVTREQPIATSEPVGRVRSAS